MRFPANLFAIRNRNGRYVTHLENIGNWANQVCEIAFYDDYNEALNYANHLNTFRQSLMYRYSPYTVDEFIIQNTSKD